MSGSALVCASGIGDGLLMMIVAHHLKKKGLSPTIFHDKANALSPLFPSHTFKAHQPIESLKHFDLILVENDHSKRAWDLFRKREESALPQIKFLFPTQSPLFKKGDILFNPKVPIATNLAHACTTLFQSDFSKANDLSLPSSAIHKKYPKRVVIHPTSNDRKRNWMPASFLKLSKLLTEKGFDPIFCVAPHERHQWEKRVQNLPVFASLKEIAHYIYESHFFIGNDSGLGHLASNLGIETVTISGNPKRVRMWRPDWAYGKVVTLPYPLPNFKGINFPLRENYWPYFISSKKVFNTFTELAYESGCRLF